MAVAGCRGLVLATLLAIVTCSSGQTTTVIHTIYWTRESVQQYSTDSPLRVRQGEIVVFNCTMANNTDSQAITRLNDSRQFDNCSCNAAPELSCTRTQLIASRCLPGFPTVSITINRNSGPLASVLDYVPGQTYYLTSFPVTFVGGFPSSAESGGACEPSADGPGLKMVMVVLSSDPDMDDEFFPTTIATTRRELMLNTSTEGLGSNGSSHSSVLIHIMFFTLVITQLITLLMSAST